MFAAFKIIGTFLLACASVIAAIMESGHPALVGCLVRGFCARHSRSRRLPRLPQPHRPIFNPQLNGGGLSRANPSCVR